MLTKKCRIRVQRLRNEQMLPRWLHMVSLTCNEERAPQAPLRGQVGSPPEIPFPLINNQHCFTQVITLL